MVSSFLYQRKGEMHYALIRALFLCIVFACDYNMEKKLMNGPFPSYVESVFHRRYTKQTCTSVP